MACVSGCVHISPLSCCGVEPGRTSPRRRRLTRRGGQRTTTPKFVEARDDDAACLEAVASHRDREAFAALYQRFAPRVTAFLRRRNASEALASEVTQEVMLSVWRKAQSYDRRRASPSSWIFAIARNRFIDRVRRQKRPLDPEDPSWEPEPDRAPDSYADAVRRRERLKRAVETLPAEQARLLHLAFAEGKTHREIAAVEGLPLGTVKSRFRLAMKKLRATLGEEPA